MLPAWNYEEVCRRLSYSFQGENHDGQHSSVRMVGLLFAPHGDRLAAEQVIPSLEYFHHRSGEHIDFFCAGYSRYEYPQRGIAVTQDDPPWMFCAQKFNQFRKDIQRRSQWQYLGETELILLNGQRGDDDTSASLDFESAIVCNLNVMIQDGAISSCRGFFEQIFTFAENPPILDPSWGFSDQMGLRLAGSALRRVVLSLLPYNVGAAYRRAEHFAIRDLS